MVQDMPTPIMTHRGDQYKSAAVAAYVNGINGSNGSPLINNDSSPAGHPQLPVPVPVPMFHQHPGFFSQSMGPPPPPPPPVMPVATAPAPPPPANPPRPSPLYSKSPDQSASFNYCEYLYHVGFLQGMFSDITVRVPALQKSYALHSLIISRSPNLYRRLMNRSHHHVIELDLRVSSDAVNTIIGHLYQPLSHNDLCFFVNENPQLCAELLIAAQELELEKLQHQILHVLAQNLTQNTVFYWMAALRSMPQQPWTEAVDKHIVHYLTQGLPTQLGAFAAKETSLSFGPCNPSIKQCQAVQGISELVRVYANLPLEYFKRCLEHENLVHDTVQRYNFAKQVLQFREQTGKRGLAVVMHFQAEDNVGIRIVRKQAYRAGRWDPSADAKENHQD